MNNQNLNHPNRKDKQIPSHSPNTNVDFKDKFTGDYEASALVQSSQLGDLIPNADVNVGTIERVASGLVGTALSAYGVKKLVDQNWITGSATLLLGAALAFRGVSGQCAVYKQLDVNTNK